jgi:hypothetical protein
MPDTAQSDGDAGHHKIGCDRTPRGVRMGWPTLLEHLGFMFIADYRFPNSHFPRGLFDR